LARFALYQGENKMLTTIPFSGFYESLHSSAIDDSINQEFSDDYGIVNNDLVYRALESADWHEVYNGYAKEYAKSFGHEFGIKSLSFESMTSPREYNFSTDRIFCEIDYAELCGIIKTFDLKAFADFVRERFTSRDGFISFYPSELAEWGRVESWDHNQCGTALEFYAIQESGGEYDHWQEYAIMENSLCNGFMQELIWQNCPEMPRLYRVFEYLVKRAA